MSNLSEEIIEDKFVNNKEFDYLECIYILYNNSFNIECKNKAKKELEKIIDSILEENEKAADRLFNLRDKIKEKIKELEQDMVLPETRQVLKELLEEV